MKLRTQLVLAFLLLSVVPLAGLVSYSYVSSVRAFRQAVWAESRAMAAEMEQRLGAARRRLKQRLDSAAALPVGSGGGGEEVVRQIADRLGEGLQPYVESLEFIPEPPAAPAAGALYYVPPRPPARPPSRTPPAVPGLAEEIRRSQEVAEKALHEALAAHQVALQNVIARSDLPAAARRKLTAEQKKTELVLGSLGCPVRRANQVIGQLQPQIRAQDLLRGVLAGVRRDQGEIPFALDAERHLYTPVPADEAKLHELRLTDPPSARPPATRRDWVVVTRQDPGTGLRFGIARPIRESTEEIGRTAARNLAWGLGLVGLACAGIFPLSGRMTRNLSALTASAERLAQGDLEARVPVASKDELGRLSQTFNRMAEELVEHQRRLLAAARLREEQEIERRLLAAEHARKSAELEQARAFQLSLLPRELPRRPDLDFAVLTRTATEVGGDYYDFLEGPDGTLTLAIGDATGHGAAAGTLVTAVKGLFMARAGAVSPAVFLAESNEVIRRMNLGRMAMALALVEIAGRRLRFSAAGMPPLLLAREGRVEEVALDGTPLGALAGASYGEREVELAPGDTLLLATDGFPELLGGEENETGQGEPLGYPRLASLFAAASPQEPERILADLTAAGEAWRGARPQGDDITFVVVKVLGAAG
ncbi:MAG TPA: SpoIIE family protein phosphatase [Thermoanaerobaculia bacterium]|nr:SpoIIE family protein phosphatase [Thermoanaerobaculia bacterium]